MPDGAPFGSSKTFNGAPKGALYLPKRALLGPMKGSGWPKKDPKRSNHPHLLDFHWWKNYDVLYCTYWITFVSTGALWPQIPSARAQFSVACSFVQDIGMWGVQTVATECPDHFMQLKLILNHPVGENVQKHHFGTLPRPNTPFKRFLGMPK